MLGTDSNFGTVVDIKTLEQILKSFSHATGLRAVFCGSDGSLEVTPGSEFPEALFCQLVRNCPRGRSRCAKSYATAGREAAKWGEPYIFRCHAGLVGWAAPVLQEEEHVSTIICSQVLMWEPEDFFWDEIWEVTKDLGVESPELALAAKQLTVISPQRVKAAADLLFLTANYLTRKGSIILEQRRAIQDQQARLQELLEERKEKYLPIYSFKKERELLEKIRVGKKEQAERILDDILADELILFVKQPDLVKTRLQELLVLISRAVVRQNSDLPAVLEANLRYSRHLAKVKTYAEVCFWARSVLREYLYRRTNQGEVGLPTLLDKVTAYIEGHYNQDLSVEGIARTVHLSSHYLCRVFKQRYGCTIMEFVTRTRIERAKELLVNSSEPVQRIGKRVGFRAPSYFSTVFKRTTGLTPVQYRRRAAYTHQHPTEVKGNDRQG